MRGALYLYVFFFKQKTAYEMRISDWSSDVCSSDLPASSSFSGARLLPASRRHSRSTASSSPSRGSPSIPRTTPHVRRAQPPESRWPGSRERKHHRSEEHTSELQSLMRISYAVFCLKKKTTFRTKTQLSLTTTHQSNNVLTYNMSASQY